jgi:DNA-binding winged helix-turn-helix (wHTH) protein
LVVAVPASDYKFGEFELDCIRFELRRDGRALKLEPIPRELLILLAEKDGHVVTRQEIVERLWGKDVFVDTEHGINTAILKIRAGLHEDAGRPRFVRMVLGKGYRLVGIRNHGQPAKSSSTPILETPGAEEISAQNLPEAPRRGWQVPVIAAIVLVLLAGALLAANFRGVRDHLANRNLTGPIQSIAVIPLANLSADPAQDYFADGMTEKRYRTIVKKIGLPPSY